MTDDRSSSSGAGSDVITWRQLWAETTRALGDRNHARWVCEVACGCEGTEFLDALDDAATERAVAHLDQMIARRTAGEPLQYVLGGWQFRTLDLLVDRRVLIPRPETEWVCEAAIGIAREMLPSRLTIVDLGTGSGAIGLSMAAELPIGAAEIWLTDESSDAIDVARANLAGVGLRGSSVRIACGSWFGALPEQLRGTIDLVVANPPYVAVGDPSLEDDVEAWEPPGALFAGPDGLDDIREIVTDASKWLSPGGALVLEIGATQGAPVAELLEANGFRHVDIRDDLAGKPRIALGHRPR